MRLLGNLNWWLPFIGVQHHPPVLAEGLGLETSRQDEAIETLSDASIGGKQQS